MGWGRPLRALTVSVATASEFKLEARSRSRTPRSENKRVTRYNEHASKHLGREFKAPQLLAVVEETESNHVSTSIWDYPLTLDYVVDIMVNASGVPTEYSVIVDSGSSNLALALASCECGSGSSSLEIGIVSDECIEVTYGSGAWWGYETEATEVGFVEGKGDRLTTRTSFAGIELQENFFEGGGYQGILGLAYASLAESYSSAYCFSSSRSDHSGERVRPGSPDGVSGRRPRYDESAEADREQLSESAKAGTVTTMEATPLLDVMYEEGLLNSNAFSLTFCGTSAEFAVGGVGTLGADITYVPCQKTYAMYYGYYLVYLESVSVDGTDIGVDASELNDVGGVLVDSGTTLIYLPSEATSRIEAALESTVGSGASKFFQMESCLPASSLDGLPDITLSVSGGYSLVLNSYQYTLNYGDCYYWGIASSDVGIIGNIALQDKIIVFDKANNLLGFGDVDCDDTAESESESSSSKGVNSEDIDNQDASSQDAAQRFAKKSTPRASLSSSSDGENTKTSAKHSKSSSTKPGARRKSLQLASSSLQLITAGGLIAAVALTALVARKKRFANRGSRADYVPIKSTDDDDLVI